MTRSILPTALFILLVSLQLDAVAQTYSIDQQRYSSSTADNVERKGYGMGLAPSELIRIERHQSQLSDSVNYTLFYYGFGSYVEYDRRFEEHPIYNSATLDVDSLWCATVGQGIEFVGFDGYYKEVHDEERHNRCALQKEEINSAPIEQKKKGGLGLLLFFTFVGSRVYSSLTKKVSSRV